MHSHKNVVITGASSGIGKEISHRLLSLGYSVIGVSRSINIDFFDNGNFQAIQADLSDEKEPKFYLIEVELVKHSFFNHIFPQITKFFAFFRNQEQRLELCNKLFELIESDSVIKNEFKSLIGNSEIFKFVNDLLDNSQNILIVIDELADLMMVASKGVEEALTRLAQMARASGIHLIVATQRPSVDVLTGIIKANFPSRMSYKVTSRVDSRTILVSMGAEKLLGKGDMLFMPPGTHRLLRIHGAMVSDEEIEKIISFIKEQKKPTYKEEIFEVVVTDKKKPEETEEYDERYDEALALVAKDRQASISYIQRRLRIGYNRAASIIEMMERDGVVGPSDGVRPREIYVNPIPAE